MRKSAKFILVTLSAVVALAGCRGIPTKKESRARAQVQAMQRLYRPDDERPALPKLQAESSLEDYLRFAMLNNPQVEAAYYDWRESVERITVERSLPDPKLTFEMFFADTVTSLMPGLMTDLPGPGKLAARAGVASAESESKYFQFQSEALQAAFAVKKSYYPLHFLSEKIRVNTDTLSLLADLEKLARAQNEVGKATLQDVLRAQIEQEKLSNEVANLEDSRRLLLAQFKAALGLRANQSDPPIPAKVEFVATNVSDDELLKSALANNPRLKQMEAEIEMAEAGIRVARKEKIPDFTAGFETDVKAAPVVWNPQFSMTLPIWRDKIAAEIAAAQHNKRAAEARLTAEQIAVGVDFAEQSFMIREAGRELSLLSERLLPRARQSLEVSRAAYRSGQVDFLNVIDAERSLLDFQLDEIAAHTEREVALAQLSLIVAGVPPAGAPFPLFASNVKLAEAEVIVIDDTVSVRVQKMLQKSGSGGGNATD